MKLNRFAFLLILSVLLSACSKDDDSPAPAFSYDGNYATYTGSVTNLRIKNLSGTLHLDLAVTKGQLRVQANEPLTNGLQITSVGGELRIEGNHNLPANLQLNFYLNPSDLMRLVVEGKNTVTIGSSPVLNKLELVTEGESKLNFKHLQVKSLVSRREGKSQMTLSSEIPFATSSKAGYLASAVTLVDNRHLIYTDNSQQHLLAAGQISVNGDSVYAVAASNSVLKAYFITQTHDLHNLGETKLEALKLPTLAVTSKNEGKSETRIWAVNTLTVTGQGESRVYVKGNPAINQTMKGSAFLVHVP